MTAAAVTSHHQTAFPWRAFVLVTLVVSLWVNASEVFRYFVIVKPAMSVSLAMVPNVVPMSLPIFLVWGIWDTLLTAMIVLMYWLVAERFGEGWRSVAAAGGLSWIFFFVLFWLGLFNMNLATPDLAARALPLALVETLIASWIAERTFPWVGNARR